MESIPDVLQKFTPISLDALERVALLDRMDTKYVFRRSELAAFLDLLTGNYRVLEIDGNRTFRYESLYFDTDDFELYNHHFTGRLNRYKVRFRNYVDSNLSFFEIKHKNNKGRTIKKRIPVVTEPMIEGKAREFLEAQTSLDAEKLEARIWVNYRRITLVSSDMSERLTFDLDLTFKQGHEEQTLSDLVIAEVKQGKSGQSEFIRIMKAHHIRKGAISKYCYGVASMFSNIRVNNFKAQLLYLNKILYAPSARA